ncbi:MAG: O-antigen ligase domain-containing protein [Chloroflexi bacterium]|nr:O-antigen ligase domain-containing protein [Chloroflexota bacterium]MDL1883960.1 O-antigen ligase family protein [Anaerolineae bacterium CFX8]
MTLDFSRLAPALRPSAPVWIILAAAVGLLVATQPLSALFLIFAFSAFFVLTAITPLAAVIFLLVLAPLRTLIATEAAFQLPLDIGQILFALLIGAWAVNRIVVEPRRLRFAGTPVSVAIILFLCVTALTAFNAVSIGAWVNEWLKWLQMLIMIVLAFDLAGDSRWHWLVFGLVLSGLANALVGLYEFFGGSGALHLLINDRFFRAFGTFGQPNPFGGFMGLLAPIALMSALGYGARIWQLWRHTRRIPVSYLFFAFFYAVSAIFLGIGILISWSRGAMLASGVSLLVMALALPRQAWRGLLIAFLVFGLLAALWFAGILPSSIIERISSSTQEFFAFEDMRGVDITPENYAVVERLAHWQAALNMAAASPWLGVGFGGYEAAYLEYRLLNWLEPLGHAHNYYLNILAETGIIGLLVYGKVWLIIMWANWRARRHPDTHARLVLIGLLGAWIYLAVHNFFDNLYVNNMFLHLGLMLGALAILYNQTWKSTRLASL